MSVEKKTAEWRAKLRTNDDLWVCEQANRQLQPNVRKRVAAEEELARRRSESELASRSRRALVFDREQALDPWRVIFGCLFELDSYDLPSTGAGCGIMARSGFGDSGMNVFARWYFFSGSGMATSLSCLPGAWETYKKMNEVNCLDVKPKNLASVRRIFFPQDGKIGSVTGIMSDVKKPAEKRDASSEVNWESVSWSELIPRLMLATHGLIRKKTWRGQRHGHIPGGYDAEDFVSAAIYKTMSGLRHWDPGKVSLFLHLYGVIKSDISHKSMSLENQNTALAGQVVDFRIVDHAPNPEQQTRQKLEMEALLLFLRDEDPLLEYMATSILEDGIVGSIELSNHLGISVAEVNNRKKRLRRRMQTYTRKGFKEPRKDKGKNYA